MVGVASSAMWYAAAREALRCSDIGCILTSYMLWGVVPAAAMLLGGVVASFLDVPHAWLMAVTAPVLALAFGAAMTMLLSASPNLVLPTVDLHFLAVAAAGVIGYAVTALLVSGMARGAFRSAGAVAVALFAAIMVGAAFTAPAVPGPSGFSRHLHRFLAASGLPLVRIDPAGVIAVYLVEVRRGSADVPYVLRYAGREGALAGRSVTVEVHPAGSATGCATSAVPVPAGSSCQDMDSGRWIYRHPTAGSVVVAPLDGGLGVVRGDATISPDLLIQEAYQLRVVDAAELARDIVAL